jgi:hypothetical protein
VRKPRSVEYELDLTKCQGYRRRHDLESWRLIITARPIFVKSDKGERFRCDGLTDFEASTIKIDGTLPKWEQFRTLLHELCHVIWNYAQEHEKIEDEEVVWMMESVLWHTLTSLFKIKLKEEIDEATKG